MARPEQLPLAFEHRVALGVEDFLVAASNRTAVDWIDRWPDWPFTALILVGPPGSGRTHLASLWRAQSHAALADLGSSGIEHAAEVAASGKPALIDDCDSGLVDAEAERALLRLYNLMRAAKRQLLLTASAPPSEWPIALPDLRSRLKSAMVVTIGPPDDELLAAIAVKLFADRQLSVGEGVVQAMLSRGERSFAGVARAVEALDRAALAAKRPITAVLTREVLASLANDEI